MTWYNNTPRKLYHSEIYIPHGTDTKFGTMLLDYSNHARDESVSDKYTQNIDLPNVLDTNGAQVIEVEKEGNKTTKVLYRVPYNEEFDLVLAVEPNRRFVRTVWLNRNSDLHDSLDWSKYEQKPEELIVEEPKIAI